MKTCTMPTRDLQRWMNALDDIRDELQADGDAELAEIAQRIDSCASCLEIKMLDSCDAAAVPLNFPYHERMGQ